MYKKKILFILPEFGFGGTVVSTLNMITLLSTYYEISVLAMSHQGPVKERYSNINVLPEDFLLASCCDAYGQIKDYRKKFFATLLRVSERLLSLISIDIRELLFAVCAKRYDGAYDYIACCQEGESTIFLSKFKYSKKIAWFRTEYSVYKDQLSRKKLNRLEYAYHHVDKIVCVSKTTRDDLAAFFPDISDNIIAIHNIQDCDTIIEKSKETVADSFDKKEFNIVSIGRFAPQKQFHLIPFIASELKKSGLRFKWYIIGDGNQQGAQDKYKESLEKYKVNDCVKAIGGRINPYPYIAMANILVSTSYYEACPRVVAESKILHTPVISSNYSSAREFIVEGETGYVYEIEKLPSIIGDLINNKEHYLTLCQRCSKYSMDTSVILNQLLSLFE